MKLFDLYRDTVILLPEGACEAVVLAARNLQRDLRRLSGHERGFEICTGGERRGAIAVETVGEGERETYTVSVTEDGVLIRGSDVLGTVFGIYAFSTKCLGVLPVHRMVDRFPQVRETMTLPACAFSSAERPVRFRGWFINDEDLLTEFRISGGHRDIDYPFYADVVDVEVLDMVLETALRLEINGDPIPASRSSVSIGAAADEQTLSGRAVISVNGTPVTVTLVAEDTNGTYSDTVLTIQKLD